MMQEKGGNGRSDFLGREGGAVLRAVGCHPCTGQEEVGVHSGRFVDLAEEQ